MTTNRIIFFLIGLIGSSFLINKFKVYHRLDIIEARIKHMEADSAMTHHEYEKLQDIYADSFAVAKNKLSEYVREINGLSKAVGRPLDQRYSLLKVYNLRRDDTEREYMVPVIRIK